MITHAEQTFTNCSPANSKFDVIGEATFSYHFYTGLTDVLSCAIVHNSFGVSLVVLM